MFPNLNQNIEEKKIKKFKRLSDRPTFCLVQQMFSRSVMSAVLRWCSARSSSSKVLLISVTASFFLSFSWREISLTSSIAIVSCGSLWTSDRVTWSESPCMIDRYKLWPRGQWWHTKTFHMAKFKIVFWKNCRKILLALWQNIDIFTIFLKSISIVSKIKSHHISMLVILDFFC